MCSAFCVPCFVFRIPCSVFISKFLNELFYTLEFFNLCNLWTPEWTLTTPELRSVLKHKEQTHVSVSVL
jgi:hypothetical protein